MSDDDVEDLLAEPPKRKRGRPRKVVVPPIKQVIVGDAENLGDGELPDPSNFKRPCTKTFLSRVLGMEPRRLDNKLSDCPVVGYDDRRNALYDFKVALGYVIEPKLDIAKWIRSQNPAHLPVTINKAFWDAEVQKLRWMERARHYWHDEDVLEVLGRCALTIKETTQLWIENLPGKEKMTSEQYEAMQANVTELLKDIHERLVQAPAERKTRAVVRSLEELPGGPEGDE